jgi:hypothetical protein
MVAMSLDLADLGRSMLRPYKIQSALTPKPLRSLRRALRPDATLSVFTV